jgi:hypothetical protein
MVQASNASCCFSRWRHFACTVHGLRCMVQLVQDSPTSQQQHCITSRGTMCRALHSATCFPTLHERSTLRSSSSSSRRNATHQQLFTFHLFLGGVKLSPLVHERLFEPCSTRWRLQTQSCCSLSLTDHSVRSLATSNPGSVPHVQTASCSVHPPRLNVQRSSHPSLRTYSVRRINSLRVCPVGRGSSRIYRSHLRWSHVRRRQRSSRRRWRTMGGRLRY